MTDIIGQLLKVKEKIIIGNATESDADTINDVIKNLKEMEKSWKNPINRKIIPAQEEMIPIDSEEEKTEIGSNIIYANSVEIYYNFSKDSAYPPTLEDCDVAKF